MNHELLKTIIYEQHEVIRNATIVERPYAFEENGNYVVVGLRRAGKTTMLYKRARDLIAAGVTWDQIIYINFEDERLAEFRLEDFNDILLVQSELSSKRGYFFLDEVQNVEGWERFARRIADAHERVYITGSNARMISSEIESRLGGRYLSMYVTPYDLNEYLTACGVQHDAKAILVARSNGRIRAACDQYLQYGGLPESLLYQSKREYISSVYQKVLLNDIVRRNKVRNDQAVRLMIKKIAETVCTEVSQTKLRNTLSGIGVSVSKDILPKYITYTEEAYLLTHLTNYYAGFVERESYPKFYFNDNGLLSLFLNGQDSALLENAVATALLRKYTRDNLFYLKSAKTGIDVDFYVPENGMAIQVAWSIAGSAREREITNLVKLARVENDATRLIIVTHEEEETIEVDGVTIEVFPLYRFLLTLAIASHAS